MTEGAFGALPKYTPKSIADSRLVRGSFCVCILQFIPRASVRFTHDVKYDRLEYDNAN